MHALPEWLFYLILVIDYAPYWVPAIFIIVVAAFWLRRKNRRQRHD